MSKTSAFMAAPIVVSVLLWITLSHSTIFADEKAAITWLNSPMTQRITHKVKVTGGGKLTINNSEYKVPTKSKVTVDHGIPVLDNGSKVIEFAVSKELLMESEELDFTFESGAEQHATISIDGVTRVDVVGESKVTINVSGKYLTCHGEAFIKAWNFDNVSALDEVRLYTPMCTWAHAGNEAALYVDTCEEILTRNNARVHAEYCSKTAYAMETSTIEVSHGLPKSRTWDKGQVTLPSGTYTNPPILDSTQDTPLSPTRR